MNELGMVQVFDEIRQENPELTQEHQESTLHQGAAPMLGRALRDVARQAD